MPDLHLRERLPELKLPEMSRDDIAKALGETRKELGEVRKDLSEYRREVEVPRMDLSKIEMPNIDIGKELRDARKDLKDAGKYMAKNAKSAAQDAGLVKRPSRLPFVIAGAITIGLVGWALANSPSIKARLQLAAKQMQEKMAARRAEWEDEEPHAFDAAVPVPVQASTYADATSDTDSPFAEPPSDTPDGFGKTNGKQTSQTTSDEPART
ncbi:MAG: hypothetical protein K0S97_793 [Chloroflexota bacterium]|nr:hypothetical protein [Chloroflexota bacterium]